MSATLAGYSALISRYDLAVPLHHEMVGIAANNHRRKENGWTILPAGLKPNDDTIAHLVFALKYEGLNLLTLKKTFEAFELSSLEVAARAKPTSAYLRRLCHLFEWLMDRRLALPDTSAGTYVLLADPKKQYGTVVGENVKRFLVRHNLPGTTAFCPIVFRTRRLDAFVERNLSLKARAVVESASQVLISRAAAFLLLSDSKATFAIEGEEPSKDRLARWGAAIGQAGSWQMSVDALVQLQRSLIGDARFVHIGLRDKGGFVGRHDAMAQPTPEHVSANADDLVDLLTGLMLFARRAKILQFDAVFTAACVAFGFVYIHPFEDGNGRIHRFLMHHILADHGFTPPDIVFPISTAILDDVLAYKSTLETVSRPLLEFIRWSPTVDGNVQVLDKTTDYYRFFDATAACEFLFACLERCIEKDLPEELLFLEQRNTFHRRVTDIVDMGERTLDLLLRFLRQGHGLMSKRARTREFAALRENEVQEVQSIYAELFKDT